MRKTFTKTCEQCGKTYEAPTKRARYCSKECTYSAKTIHKYCVICGKEYKSKNAKTKCCSAACGHEATKTQIKATCSYCGKTTRREGKHDALYCNDECKHNAYMARHEALLTKRAEQESIKQNERDKAARDRKAERERIAEEYRASRLIYNRVCLECGAAFTTKNNAKKYCSKECGDKRGFRIKDLLRRTRLIENGEIDYSISLTKLIKKDKGTCHICGQRVDEGDCYHRDDGTFMAGNRYPSIDHVKPVSMGGTHAWNNVRLAHRYCNSVKSDSLFYESANKQMSMCV